jgi:hypothetical protein
VSDQAAHSEEPLGFGIASRHSRTSHAGIVAVDWC